MKKTLLILTATLLLTACNTFQGMGKDIEGAGEGISSSAKKVKEKL